MRKHCFDGRFYTDGLTSIADPHQVWAALCEAATGESARDILNECLSSRSDSSLMLNDEDRPPSFTLVSTAMSFYTLRAFSLIEGTLYDDHFHSFWDPWREQLSQNLTTWVEDSVSLRSDCHAWGSVPLYGFMAEVCGIRPAAPRWTKITFKPRVSLFEKLDAKVPLYSKDGDCSCEMEAGA